MVRQHVKLTVVLVAVVLALTGFSSSSHGGKGGKSRSGKSKSSSSSGGGCSNSKKSNGTYHDTDYDDDDDYSSSSSSSGSTYGTPTPTATATDAPQAYVFRCAAPRKGKRKAVTTSTVRLTANAVGSHTYEVDVKFLDAVGNTVDTGEATVQADGGDTKTVSVRMASPGKVSRVKKCAVTAELSY
ncbi:MULTISPECIES: hypothetical protein [unclassified Streptomyces]|uniref:hypothetical protein n=1 Tax=unclassified Streptomyces TaxID=2593676 RepID=UPI002DD936AE|nr:hypothetical protein [Streptomyces sp. NBC_01257]WRZ66578.1 hypothetical protein OG408_23130 [Streptomyces sp. NBC_01257]WSU60570.1 hypothetical protein OG450_23280 [Streptomyces sp. NBC_01104]